MSYVSTSSSSRTNLLPDTKMSLKIIYRCGQLIEQLFIKIEYNNQKPLRMLFDISMGS